jgi:hypothetical protein
MLCRLRATNVFPLLILLSACTHDAARSQDLAPPIAHKFAISGWEVRCWGGPETTDYNCSMARRVSGVGPFRIVFSPREIELFKARCGPDDAWTEETLPRGGQATPSAQAVYQDIRRIVENCNSAAMTEVEGARNLMELLLRATN